MNWYKSRGLIGFLLGLIFLVPLVAFTTLPITGLPLATPIVWLVFVVAFNVYLINGFLHTVFTILFATFMTVSLLSQGIELLGIPLAAAMHLPSLTKPLDGEYVAGAMAVVILGGSRIWPQTMMEQVYLLRIFGITFSAALAVFSLASHAIGAAVVFGLYSGYLFLTLRAVAKELPGRGFVAIWTAIQPFDAKFASYVAARLPTIALITLVYVYVVVMFSGIYYYVDNCDSANFPCSLVDYQPFLSKDKPDLSKDKPECLSFSSIRPQVADGANPCISHRNATEFSFEKFLPYFYFSVVTTTTVGYGDITPISNSAVWIVIFHHLTSIILLVGVVAQLTNLQATECECAEDE